MLRFCTTRLVAGAVLALLGSGLLAGCTNADPADLSQVDANWDTMAAVTAPGDGDTGDGGPADGSPDDGDPGDGDADGAPDRLTKRFTLGPPSAPVDREALPEGNVAAAYSSASQDFRRAAASRSWRHAHDRIQALLEERGLFPSTDREQMAAFAFLSEHLEALREDGVTPEEAEAIGFYAERLVKNRNPESPLLLPALRALRGHWPDDRLARAAHTTRRAARQEHDDASATAHLKRVAEANQALEALASDLSGTGDRE